LAISDEASTDKKRNEILCLAWLLLLTEGKSFRGSLRAQRPPSVMETPLRACFAGRGASGWLLMH
jgi:hypothetical protein